MEALAALRADPRLAEARFVRAPDDGDGPHVTWWSPAGAPMDEPAWGDGAPFGMMLTRYGRRDTLIVLNPGDDAEFTLPQGRWVQRLDTAEDPVAVDRRCEGQVTLGWQSVALFGRLA